MARVTWRKLRLGVTRWQLIGGSLLGLFVGLMVGIMIGAPMALVTYGSITDAIVNNQDKTFSLDKNKTDIPGVVLANRVKEHWGLAVAYIWKQFYMSVGVGAAVGLGFGFVATLAAGSAKIAMATRSNASTAYADMRYRLLPMR